MFKPTRGYQKPAMNMVGINHFALVKFMEWAAQKCKAEGEADSSLRFELAADYFRNEYQPGKPIKMNGTVIGF
jgi:hypothetical protein